MTGKENQVVEAFAGEPKMNITDVVIRKEARNLGDRVAVDRTQIVPFTPAAFRRAWADDSLTCAEVGARFGLNKCAAWRRAKSLDLPNKKSGQKANRGRDAKIARLWLLAIPTSKIAEAVGVSRSAISQRSVALGLPQRPKGRASQMTLAQYRETLLAKAMAETARIEQRQIKLAEMWDQPGHQRSGKRAA